MKRLVLNLQLQISLFLFLQLLGTGCLFAQQARLHLQNSDFSITAGYRFAGIHHKILGVI